MTKIYLFEIKKYLMYFIWCLNVFMVVLLGKFTISPPFFFLHPPPPRSSRLKKKKFSPQWDMSSTRVKKS